MRRVKDATRGTVSTRSIPPRTGRREGRLEPIPVDLPGQLHQFMGGVEQLIEMTLKQFKGVAVLRFRGAWNPFLFCKVLTQTP